ncbi:sucrase ferredoxin [Rhodococcus sp. LB1]|uniref:sucrase ferredoxin n=1 Tax=Rhodococcus sp. LB1 TaxID=1807499 RepID=UPI00077A5F8B|nr:sucrase ferredoxin [Rhodococcus sp. LB1]KXX55709.1 sucrase ferredoxin [Rhodococcus sp. LB1]
MSVQTTTSPEGWTPPACAALSRSLLEPLCGSAPRVRGWLLIEQPGPWGRDRLRQSRLDPVLGDALAGRCADAGVRPVLIRTRQRRDLAAGRHVYLVRPGRADGWAERLLVREDRELIDLDLDLSPGVGERLDPAESLFLVCTHGKKDACCASFGRPVVTGLGHRDGRVWESTHVGGDRFAATMVCLPSGIYYGRVTAEAAEHIVAEHDHGRVVLEHYRGRCTDDPVLQFAEHTVRAERSLLGLDDVIPLSATPRTDGDTDVLVRHPAGTDLVRVRTTRAEPRLTACSAGVVDSPDRFEAAPPPVRRSGS